METIDSHALSGLGNLWAEIQGRRETLAPGYLMPRLRRERMPRLRRENPIKIILMAKR
jgi:hypothetical protein